MNMVFCTCNNFHRDAEEPLTLCNSCDVGVFYCRDNWERGNEMMMTRVAMSLLVLLLAVGCMHTGGQHENISPGAESSAVGMRG